MEMVRNKINDNTNTLIKVCNADTINEIHGHIEWLCLISDNDENIHPGMIQSLNMLRVAVKSLKTDK